MQEYEQGASVAEPADAVFAWVSDVDNLPKNLPSVKDAGLDGPSEEIPGRGEFDSEGYLDVDARTMRWGAESGRGYSGRLDGAGAGEGACRVTVQLSFGPRSAEPEIQERSSEDRDPLQESLAATLQSIRRQIEEGSGKQPSPSQEG